MTLSDIFTQLLAGESVSVCVVQAQYNSLRVALLRKFRLYADQCAGMGIEEFSDQYVSCKFNSVQTTATFKLAYTDTKQRRVIDYRVL